MNEEQKQAVLAIVEAGKQTLEPIPGIIKALRKEYEAQVDLDDEQRKEAEENGEDWDGDEADQQLEDDAEALQDIYEGLVTSFDELKSCVTP